MIHRLRTRRCPEFDPVVAAQVLESRALLSAGAAAAVVHAATHHAAVQTHSVEPLAAFHGTVNIGVAVTGLGPGTVPGNFSLSNFNASDGAHVKASFSLSVGPKGDALTIKGTVDGTISNVQVIGAATAITLDPTGGSVKLTDTSHGHMIRETAIPDGTQLHLNLENGVFAEMTASDVFKANSTDGFAGKTISIDIKPSP